MNELKKILTQQRLNYFVDAVNLDYDDPIQEKFFEHFPELLTYEIKNLPEGRPGGKTK